MTLLLMTWQTTAAISETAESEAWSKAETKWRIPVADYFANPEFLEMAEQIWDEFLSHETRPSKARQMALAMMTYIGPEVVSGNRFIPPDGHNLSQMDLEMMAEKSFPDEGCRIERLWLTHPDHYGEYMVLLVDASDHPSYEYIESCLLLATATAIGEDLDGQPIMTNDALRDFLRKAVNGVKP